MSVMIGIGPHKGSDTAVVVDRDEVVIDEIRVKATAKEAIRALKRRISNVVYRRLLTDARPTIS